MMADTDVAVDRTRLFGLPGAMSLHFALNDAIEQAWDYADKDRPPPVVEEFTVREPQYHLPTADVLIEHCVETAADTETDEDAYDDFANAAKHPDVIAAFQAAIDVMASKVTYRMADKLVAVWHPPEGDAEEWRREASQ